MVNVSKYCTVNAKFVRVVGDVKHPKRRSFYSAAYEKFIFNSRNNQLYMTNSMS